MKTAIVYYSMHGNVRYVSEKVAKELGADLIELVPVKAYPDKGAMQFIWGGSAVTFKKKPELEPYTFNASDYDLVIIGTPVWASNFTVIATSAGGDSSKCLEAVKAAAKADSLAAVLSLTDPKDKPSDENEKQIAAFIETCKGL